MNSGLKPKQRRFIEAFKSGRFSRFCAAGTTGSGKTFVTLGLLHLLCRNIAGLRFGVIRKTEKNLKQTSIPSYNQLKFKTKSMGSSYISDMRARYTNGSEILFIWGDITKDPELNNLRGIEFTGALIEEANQVDRKYFDLLKTRIGRWNNHKCKAFILLNLNPSLGWVKEEFYDKWVEGTLPPNCYFEEFDEQDAIDCSGSEYVQGLSDLPEEEYKRFVKNRWDYSEVQNQLIRFEWYKQCWVTDYVIKNGDRGILAIDPAGGNKNGDDTVYAQMHGNHIGWWEAYKDQDPSISALTGIERAKEFNVSPDDVLVDSIGVGMGTVSTMRLKNFYPTPFIAGEPAEDQEGFLGFFNKRSEGLWLLREALKKDEISISPNAKFQKQALSARYKTDDRKIRVMPKEDIKKQNAGESPGELDVAMMLAHRKFTSAEGLARNLMDRQLQRHQVGIMSRAQLERMQAIRKTRLAI